MDKTIISIVVGAVLVGLSFSGGMMYGQNENGLKNLFVKLTPEDREKQLSALAAVSGLVVSTPKEVSNNQNFPSGKIIARDNKSLTVEFEKGISKIVFFEVNTPITKGVAGSLQELIIGEQIIVTGSINQDGSISAQSLLISSK